MDQAPTILTLILGLSAMLAVYLTAWAQFHSRVPAAREFSLLMLGVAIYSLGYSIEISRNTLESSFQIIYFEYLGLATFPTMLLLFALHFVRRKPLSRSLTALMMIVPITTILMVWTSRSHQLYYIDPHLASGEFYRVFVFERGLWYWVNFIWADLTTIAAFILLLVNAVRAPKKQRRQAVTIAAGVFLSILVSVLNLFGLIPGYIEPVSFGNVVGGLFLAYALFRLGLFELVPAARELALDSIRDAFLVLDRRGNLQDINHATLNLPGAAELRIGSPLPEENPLAKQLNPLLTGEEKQLEFSMESPDGAPHFYHAKAYPIKTAANRDNGTAILVSDITETIGLVKKLNQQATTDQLTGIYNRHYLMQWGFQELERARLVGTHLGIMMIDLDHFKQVNDAHGHLAGDEVLCRVARCIQAGLRDGDILGRFGGEELLAFLPGADLRAVIQVAERLRGQVEALTVPFAGEKITTTASFGVHAFYGEDELSLDRLLQIADRALYKAKSAGRNRVESLTQAEIDAEPASLP